MYYDTDQSGALQSAAAVALSHCYWELNDSFCCIHCRRDSQCFSVGWITPQNCPSPRDLDPHLTHGSLGLTESAPKRHLDRFCHLCTAHPYDQYRQTDRQTDTQTTTRVTSFVIGYACDAAWKVRKWHRIFPVLIFLLGHVKWKKHIRPVYSSDMQLQW